MVGPFQHERWEPIFIKAIDFFFFQLPSADFLQSSSWIPLSTAHELKMTGFSEMKMWFQTQNNEYQWEECPFISFFFASLYKHNKTCDGTQMQYIQDI